MKLTKANVAKFPAPDPSGKQKLHWDSELKGFGVLCSGVKDTKTFIVQRALPGGRKRRLTVGQVAEFWAAGKTMEDVRREAADLLLDLRHGRDPKAAELANLTLNQALELYLKARPNLAAGSWRGYRRAVEHYFRSWRSRPLREISPDMIEARLHDIKNEVGNSDSVRRRRSDIYASEPGSATAVGAMRALRAIWKHAAARADGIPPWPTERLRGQWYKVPRRERHVPADKLRDFYKAVNEQNKEGEYVLGRTIRDYILLLLFTGMRRGEAAALTWSEVDFAGRVLRISSNRTKSKRTLDLPMTDMVRELLVSRRALGVEGDFVFPGDGKSGHLAEPKKAFLRIADSSGVRANPHALRATYITIANDVAMSVFVLKSLVGHSAGNDVTGGYTQLSVESLRRPAQQVANKIKKHCGVQEPKARNVRKLAAKKSRARA